MILRKSQNKQSLSSKKPKWTLSISHLKSNNSWAVRESKIARFMKDPPMILGSLKSTNHLAIKGLNRLILFRTSNEPMLERKEDQK